MQSKVTLKSIYNQVIEFNLLKLAKPSFILFVTLTVFYICWLGYLKIEEIKSEKHDREKLVKMQIKWDERASCIEKINDIKLESKINSYLDCANTTESVKKSMLDAFLLDEMLARQYIRAVNNNHAEGKRPVRCDKGKCY